MKGLASTKRELEAGVADAETESHRRRREPRCARACDVRGPSKGRQLETLIHGVFRFDEAGQIALLYLTPYDLDAVNDFLT